MVETLAIIATTKLQGVYTRDCQVTTQTATKIASNSTTGLFTLHRTLANILDDKIFRGINNAEQSDIHFQLQNDQSSP